MNLRVTCSNRESFPMSSLSLFLPAFKGSSGCVIGGLTPSGTRFGAGSFAISSGCVGSCAGCAANCSSTAAVWPFVCVGGDIICLIENLEYRKKDWKQHQEAASIYSGSSHVTQWKHASCSRSLTIQDWPDCYWHFLLVLHIFYLVLLFFFLSFSIRPLVKRERSQLTNTSFCLRKTSHFSLVSLSLDNLSFIIAIHKYRKIERRDRQRD